MSGQKITIAKGKLTVPNNPIIPFIEGDGIGPDIWAAAVKVFDEAVKIAYKGEREIEWLEVMAGEKSFTKTGDWLPQATLNSITDHLVAIKGPLTTPVGGGIRSLNVALRQNLDLYVCLRPVKWYNGVPTPVKHPELVDMVVFRENTEDIYAGIEYLAGSEDSDRLLHFMEENFPKDFDKIRFGSIEKNKQWKALLEEQGLTTKEIPVTVGLGIKPVSYYGCERIVNSAIKYAIENNRKNVTIVHKGNIMKFTEGGFRDWAYKVAKEQFGAVELNGGPWMIIPEGKPGAGIIIKDSIADAFLQQILTRPTEYDVVVTLNLNGDYVSDALAAQVGGIGIAPGANINYVTGHAIFEATHGTAPKYAGLDKVNPGSVILSGVMMFEYLGWLEAANLIVESLSKAIESKYVTYDFARMMDNPTEVKCSEFANKIIEFMK